MIRSILSSLLFVGLLVNVSEAEARSLHPCTPVVRMRDSRMSCPTSTGAIFSVRIETLHSPLRHPSCQGENAVEHHTAKIEVSDGEGIPVGTMTLYGAFEYSLGVPGMSNGWLRSEKAGVNLEGCVAPAHNGGMSVGN